MLLINQMHLISNPWLQFTFLSPVSYKGVVSFSRNSVKTVWIKQPLKEKIIVSSNSDWSDSDYIWSLWWHVAIYTKEYLNPETENQITLQNMKIWIFQ